MCRNARFCRYVSRMPRMSFCCVQQNAPNQRLPQPDFGAESNGTWIPQSTRISRLGLDGRAPLRLHLTPEVLNNCGGSNCFARSVNWYAPRTISALMRSAPSLAAPTKTSSLLCSHAAFQTRALVTSFQQTLKVGSSSRKSRGSPSHPHSRGQTSPICSLCSHVKPPQ